MFTFFNSAVVRGPGAGNVHYITEKHQYRCNTSIGLSTPAKEGVMGREHLGGSEADDALKDYGAAMRVSDVAKELAVSPATVYRLADRGDLKRLEIRLTGDHPTVRIQKASVVSLLTAWLEGRQSGGDR